MGTVCHVEHLQGLIRDVFGNVRQDGEEAEALVDYSTDHAVGKQSIDGIV